MAYYISLGLKALVEIQKAYDWYELQKDGLGNDFLEELEICYKKLINNPERFPFINNSTFRRIKTSRFPYIIVYEIEEDTISINSIRHNKRRPL